MALLDDGMSRGVLTAAATVTGAFLLSQFALDLTPNLRSVAISGLKLLAEAEFEMQDAIVAKLAEKAVDALLQTMQAGQSPRIGKAAARRIIHDFEQSARERSNRASWHEQDRKARYRHHIRRLKMAVAQTARGLTPEQQEWMAQATAGIAEDW